MLSPEYLRRITEGSEQIAEELHQYIISEIVSRMIARIGRGEDYILTNADAWRIRTLQESGELLEDILAELSKYTKREQQELLEAFEDAGITAMSYDDKIYKAAGLSPVPLEQSPTMIRLMERNMLATMGEWKNFTRTTASVAQRLYIEQCDIAYNHVMTGAVGYTQAIKEAVNNVVSDGVYVEYINKETGKKRRDTIETAVARSVRTGVAQACADIQLTRMKEMGYGLVLTSAHIGSRPSHEVWQGQVFSIDWEKLKEIKPEFFQERDTPEYRRMLEQKAIHYPDFIENCHYGEADGICGVNCRHHFSVWVEGMPNPYAELSAQDKADKGKQYEKEQRQRAYERRIRKTKREVLGLQAGVDNAPNEKSKFALQQDLDRKSYLLQKQNAAYKDYCKQNDLRELQDRLMIAKWKRQNAAKARGAAKRYKTAKGIKTDKINL